MDYYYKQPKYFSKFRCIGGICPQTCCEKWRIDWTQDEVEKLNAAESGEELKEIFKTMFLKADSGDYYVDINADGICPAYDKCTGLCKIQRDMGEVYLSRVCKIYPRNYLANRNVLFRYCTASCSAVIDLLAKDENATEVEYMLARGIEQFRTVKLDWDNEERLKEFPYLKYRFEIVDLFAFLLQNKQHTIETSLITGAFAAKQISKVIGEKKYDTLPNVISSLRSELNSGSIAKSIDRISPNNQVKFKLVNNLIVLIFNHYTSRVDISALHDGNALIEERYNEGLENFYKAMGEKRFLLKSLIINMFYDLNMPFKLRERTVYENYSYFILCSAVIKTIAAAIGYKQDNVYENFREAVAELTRGLTHNIKKISTAIDDMNNLGLTTPAHLALIIK